MKDGEILRKAATLIEDYLDRNADSRTPVVEYLEPEELRRRFDVSLGAGGESVEDLFPALRACLRYSVRTGHPQFMNQLYAGFNPAAFVGDAFDIAVTAFEIDWRERLWRTTLDHLALVGLSLGAALIIALPLGVLAARRARLGQIGG